MEGLGSEGVKVQFGVKGAMLQNIRTLNSLQQMNDGTWHRTCV